MANQWFKFYGGEYLSDPKIERLSPLERSCWVTLLCLASMNGKGKIEFLTVESLLNKSGIQFDPYRPEEWENALSVLKKFQKMKMIDVSEDGDILIINWDKRQEHNLTVAERVAKHRAKKRNVTTNVTNVTTEENRIEENRIENTDTNCQEKKEITAISFLVFMSENGYEPYEYQNENDFYDTFQHTETKKVLGRSQLEAWKNKYDRSVGIEPKVITTGQISGKKAYARSGREVPISYESAFSRKMIEILKEEREIPSLDGRYNHKAAEGLKEKLVEDLKKRGFKEEELEDKVILEQFKLMTRRVSQKSPFHFKNMTSIEYIDRYFQKILSDLG